MRMSDWSSYVCSSDLTAVLAYQTTALNDTIYALAGNGVIDGGAGADYMDGGAGNDSFYVDTWSDDGFAGNDDQVIELAGGGSDLVYASVSYRLAANVEKLTMTGAAAINGMGNELTNTIRSEEHTSELQSLMRISYAVFCLKNKKTRKKKQY